MIINFSDIPEGAKYHLIIQAIIPRPIAWVLSDHGNGAWNLAPFSFFTGVTAQPPLLMISVGSKSDDQKKDTWRNIEERNHFVVHIPALDQGKAVVETGKELAHGESELRLSGLVTENVEGWKLPRVVGAKAAFYCQRYKIIEVDLQQAIILGEILSMWVDPKIVAQNNGRILLKAALIDPLARLGGREYTSLGPIQSI